MTTEQRKKRIAELETRQSGLLVGLKRHTAKKTLRMWLKHNEWAIKFHYKKLKET